MNKSYLIEFIRPDGGMRKIVVQRIHHGGEALIIGQKIADAIGCEYYMHTEIKNAE